MGLCEHACKSVSVRALDAVLVAVCFPNDFGILERVKIINRNYFVQTIPVELCRKHTATIRL